VKVRVCAELGNSIDGKGVAGARKSERSRQHLAVAGLRKET